MTTLMKRAIGLPATMARAPRPSDLDRVGSAQHWSLGSGLAITPAMAVLLNCKT